MRLLVGGDGAAERLARLRQPPGLRQLTRQQQDMSGVAGIELDRKSLADLAVKQPETFAAIAGQAKEAINKKSTAAA